MGGIRTTIARLCAAAFDRLLDIFGGDDTVNRRSALFYCKLPERLGNLSVDIVRMCRGPLNHAAEADDRIIFSGVHQLGNHERYLERTRNPYDIHILFVAAVTHDCIQRAPEELADEELIES